jgi:hypothetical protein
VWQASCNTPLPVCMWRGFRRMAANCSPIQWRPDLAPFGLPSVWFRKVSGATSDAVQEAVSSCSRPNGWNVVLSQGDLQTSRTMAEIHRLEWWWWFCTGVNTLHRSDRHVVFSCSYFYLIVTLICSRLLEWPSYICMYEHTNVPLLFL